MNSYAQEIGMGRRLMETIVDPGTRLVRTMSLKHLHNLLLGLGYVKFSEQEFGPPGGRQLFYKNGKIVVRVKTKGDARGPRTGQPHVSAGLTDGRGMDWYNDLAKFNYRGQLAAKSLTTAEQFQPTDFQGKPQRFVVIMGGQYDGPGGDAWANRTHFPFPPNFTDDLGTNN